jgi:hypothetical protein
MVVVMVAAQHRSRSTLETTLSPQQQQALLQQRQCQRQQPQQPWSQHQQHMLTNWQVGMKSLACGQQREGWMLARVTFLILRVLTMMTTMIQSMAAAGSVAQQHPLLLVLMLLTSQTLQRVKMGLMMLTVYRAVHASSRQLLQLPHLQRSC